MRSFSSKVLLSLLFFFIPYSTHAASFELLGFATRTDPRGDNRFGDSRIDVRRGDTGFGAGVNVVWTRMFSTEFAASTSRSRVDAFVTPGAPASDFGSLRMMPVTATLQVHFLSRSRVDPYVGAGAAYVHFNRLRSTVLSSVGVDSIHFKNQWAGVANAGINLDLVQRVGVFLDGKYIPVKAKGTTSFTSGAPESLDIKVNPLILSAGLRLRF